MTLQDRASAYAARFPAFPASYLTLVREAGGPVLYGTWLFGNNYRNKTEFYGAYPPGYLARVMALFPDFPDEATRHEQLPTLHVFSGSLPAGPYLRCDIRQPAELQKSVYDLDPDKDGSYSLVFADPPYSASDAERYDTPMVDRRRALAALARITAVGGFLVWLDCVWPMHRKTDWRTVGRITLIRSTNHRVRLVSIFERSAA